MFFKNATMYRFPSDFTIVLSALVAGLHENKLKDVGQLEMSSVGFIPVTAGDDRLALGIGLSMLFAIGKQERILPVGVVNEELAKRLAKIEESEGRKPGGRTSKRLKDDVITEMMPRAFVKSSRTYAIIDFERKVVYVDTASRSVGDAVISLIRRAWGSFPAVPLTPQWARRGVMSGWVANTHSMPDGIMVGDECELTAASESGGVVGIRRMELGTDEVCTHLDSGMQVSKLMLHFDAGCSAVVTEGLGLRKIKLSDVAMDKLDDQEIESVVQEVEARLALMVGVLGGCFDSLDGAFTIADA